MVHNRIKNYIKKLTDEYKAMFYIQVSKKFYICHGIALSWLLFSIYLSLNWVIDLSNILTMPISILIITGIAYIPGYINCFTIISLILNRQPKNTIERPNVPVTILIACHNEEKVIGVTLQYLYRQDYDGEIHVIVIDNNSTDNTKEIAESVGKSLNMNLKVITEEKKGKQHALNTALALVETEFTITLDADTLLMPKSVNYLVARQMSSPDDVVATAGSVLVRNSRVNIWTKLQEWDYFLGIANIKRMQGLYRGTLVAQGAYSIYKTDKLREIGGYPDVIGEDIVITWNLLKEGYKIEHEPYAVAFTDAPETFIHLQRQRSRWARGMIEALRRVKPWQQPSQFVAYATTVNLLMPFIDAIYTLVWIPGVILAFFGLTWVAGPMTLLLLPLALIQNTVLFISQKRTFDKLGLRIRRNILGFWVYVLFYQAIMSPISLFGYIEEVFNFKRVWK